MERYKKHLCFAFSVCFAFLGHFYFRIETASFVWKSCHIRRIFISFYFNLNGTIVFIFFTLFSLCHHLTTLVFISSYHLYIILISLYIYHQSYIMPSVFIWYEVLMPQTTKLISILESFLSHFPCERTAYGTFKLKQSNFLFTIHEDITHPA